MVKLKPSLLGSCLLCFSVLLASAAQYEDKKVYVVYMGALPEEASFIPTTHHRNVLQEIIGDRYPYSSMENRLVRSYKRSFNGFAARFSESEVERITGMKGVVSVFPDVTLQLQTTGSWNFMGLIENTTKRVPSVESDTIIGAIDSGIWPESQSFNDDGFSPPPEKWKGVCNGGLNFTCNNKVIGARFYTEDSTARDHRGHGSHTASTAAGNSVSNASFFGVGAGTARGAVPSARIAVYKACDSNGCTTSSLLAAFDDAISDGVDVITISIGSTSPMATQSDAVAIGAFHAMTKGILTVQSAGNSGPLQASTGSIAPWILSVAASNINRQYVTNIVLGDGKTLVGKSLNSFDLNGEMYPLVYGKSVTSTCDERSAKMCRSSCLDSKLVKGKIVMCDDDINYTDVESAGAIGAILLSSETDDDDTSIFYYPVSALSTEIYESLVSYVDSTMEPKASIMKTVTIPNPKAPAVALFSSRGPNVEASDILKPDLTAPGVDILAAFSPDASVSHNEQDKRKAKYSVLSGTSMACPHVAGVAAYVKTFHPDWSGSMIKSAIMTTTWPMNSSVNVEAEFAYGSGHLNPIAAVNPGLIYETTKADYDAFLCGMNLTSDAIRTITGQNETCMEKDGNTLTRNLNYPSMATQVDRQTPFNVSFFRTLTNVDTMNSTYKATVVKGAGSSSTIDVKVDPEVLTFDSVNEKNSFTVTVSGQIVEAEGLVSWSLVWTDDVHTVRSPIVVYTFPM